MNLEKAEIVEIVEFMKEALNAKCLNKKNILR